MTGLELGNRTSDSRVILLRPRTTAEVTNKIKQNKNRRRLKNVLNISNNKKRYFYEETKKIPNTNPLEIKIGREKMQ